MNRAAKAQWILCAAALFGAANNAQAQQARVAVAEFLKPYANVLLEVMREAGFTPKVDYYPAERAFRLLQSGQVDLDFGRQAESVEDFKSQVRLIGPIGCVEVVAFVDRRRPLSVKTASDLKGRQVVAILGTKMSLRYLDDAGIKYSTVAIRENAYRMLELGRADVVIDISLSGLPVIKALRADQHLQIEGPVLATRPGYLVLRHHLDDWGPRLQTVYEAAWRSGKLLTLLASVNTSLGLPPGVGTSCLKDDNLLPKR